MGGSRGGGRGEEGEVATLHVHAFPSVPSSAPRPLLRPFHRLRPLPLLPSPSPSPSHSSVPVHRPRPPSPVPLPLPLPSPYLAARCRAAVRRPPSPRWIPPRKCRARGRCGARPATPLGSPPTAQTTPATRTSTHRLLLLLRCCRRRRPRAQRRRRGRPSQQGSSSMRGAHMRSLSESSVLHVFSMSLSLSPSRALSPLPSSPPSLSLSLPSLSPNLFAPACAAPAGQATPHAGSSDVNTDGRGLNATREVDVLSTA